MIEAPPGAGFFAAHTVAGLAADLRAGRLSPADLVGHALAAAARLGSLNAFVTLDEPGARAAARRAADELAAGVDRGPLHGIPVAVKDLVDTAGLRTTMGSRHFADHVPAHDAACVHRLREAGAIVVGKTVTHEFAYGPTGDQSAHGAARNPYRPGAMSGGSSAGSAVAVAAGIVPLAVGTDTGGSVRIPAACCGITGCGPPPAPSRSPASSRCPRLWTRWGRSPGPSPTAACCGGCWPRAPPAEPDADVRIGWVAPESLHPTEIAVAEAARRLVPDADDVAMPDGRALQNVYRVIQSSEAYAIHAERVATAPDLFGDELVARLRAAEPVRGWEYVRALADRRRAVDGVGGLFAGHDVLALPTLPVTAPPVGARHGRIRDTEIDIRAALLALTSPWSVLGLPALSVPAGLVDGMPAGLQLVAPPGREELLLATAERLGQLPSGRSGGGPDRYASAATRARPSPAGSPPRPPGRSGCPASSRCCCSRCRQPAPAGPTPAASPPTTPVPRLHRPAARPARSPWPPAGSAARSSPTPTPASRRARTRCASPCASFGSGTRTGLVPSALMMSLSGAAYR